MKQVPISVYWAGWREVLDEILEGFEVQENVSPPWLVNPHTGRRLKFDLYYPQIRLAVRFRGVSPTARRRRMSDQELEADVRRDDVRRLLSREHGIAFVSLRVVSEDPRRELDRLHTALSTVTRHIVHASMPQEQKVALVDAVRGARKRLLEIRERLRRQEDLVVYADRRRDRETAALREARREAASRPVAIHQRYEVGMRVRHIRYGEGKVVAVEAKEDGDWEITVDFLTSGQRKFLASLLTGKLDVI